MEKFSTEYFHKLANDLKFDLSDEEIEDTFQTKTTDQVKKSTLSGIYSKFKSASQEYIEIEKQIEEYQKLVPYCMRTHFSVYGTKYYIDKMK